MDYRAVLTLDYTKPTPNEYNRLLNALAQSGWTYAETSAMYIEATDTEGIRLALELLARAVDTPGTLSAMTVQVQLVGERSETPAAKFHRQAKNNLLKLPLPSEE